MSYTIAVSGKGGVGKTTIAALTVKFLLGRGGGPVFAVDADPNSNLADQLGVEEYGTVGGLREELSSTRTPLPAGMSKPEYIRYRIQETVSESRGFDLLTMGRPEGKGCYCYVNSLLRDYLDGRGGNYPYLVIDNEAGMEHLSRRTTRDVDLLLVVSDTTPVALTAAARIADMARGLDLRIRSMGALLNRVDAVPEAVAERLRQAGLPLLGVIPADRAVAARAAEGTPLLDIGEETEAFSTLSRVLARAMSAGAAESAMADGALSARAVGAGA